MGSNTYYPPGTVCAVDLSTARKFSPQQITVHQKHSMSGNTARRPQRKIFKDVVIKETVSRDFLLLVFFMGQFPLGPRVSHKDRFKFFRKFAEIFASQGAPPVSTTPVAKYGKHIRLQTL
jgi:hypothetical protein